MAKLYHPQLDVTKEVTDRAAVHMKGYGWVDAEDAPGGFQKQAADEDSESESHEATDQSPSITKQRKSSKSKNEEGDGLDG